MISLSYPLGDHSRVLPRRDLNAILPYLNRKEFDAKPAWEQARQVEGVLAAAGLRLAHAVSSLVPVPLPTGTTSLPPLGGRLFAAYRLAWWLLLFAALAAVA